MTALRQHWRPFLPACSAGPRRQRVTCRMVGPGGYNFGGGGQQDGRLVFPGQEGGAGGPKKLVLPGQQQQAGPGPARPVGDLPSAQNQFRPPPGFMDAVGRPAVEDAGLSVDEMLSRLRTNSGQWHQLAKLLPALARAGCDSVVVEETVGLERRLQNVWTAAEQVYESVKKSGELSPAELAHFDGEGGESLLYELRFLSITQRTAAARYIARNNLSEQEALVLARSVKEHERRIGTKEGFSVDPGDCLAYKFYREAMECRRKEDAEACVQKGLAVAVSESARAKLASMLSKQEAAAAEQPAAQLTILRMTKDELGFRVVSVPGSLQECSAAQLRAAPKVSSDGVFGNFRVPGGDHVWVALPNWSVLQLAGHPVALSVPNCADVPEIRSSSFAKTDDELKRLQGTGLMVVDVAPGSRDLLPDAYYLVAEGQALRLAEGGAVGGGEVLGPVLFLCRPPARDGGLAGSTSELLSL